MQEIDKLEEQLDRVVRSATACSKSKSFDVFELLETVESIGKTEIMSSSTMGERAHEPNEDHANDVKLKEAYLEERNRKLKDRVDDLQTRINELVDSVDQCQGQSVISRFLKFFL